MLCDIQPTRKAESDKSDTQNIKRPRLGPAIPLPQRFIGDAALSLTQLDVNCDTILVRHPETHCVQALSVGPFSLLVDAQDVSGMADLTIPKVKTMNKLMSTTLFVLFHVHGS